MRPSVTEATGDDAPAQLENLLDLGVADDGLAMLRIEHAGHRFLHLVDQFVDDAVKLDLHAFAFGGVRRRCSRPSR